MQRVWGSFIVVMAGWITLTGAQEAQRSHWMEAYLQGWEAYSQGDWERAQQTFQRILRELQIAQTTRRLTTEESTVYQWCLDYLGRYYLTHQQPDQARLYYTTLLRVNPHYAFPDTPPPIVQTFLEDLRLTLLGFLTLYVQPPDAIVYLDGLPIGSGTLVRYPVVQGSRQLRVERPGFAPWQRTVEIKAGEALELEPVVLERIGAAVFVATAPRGVEVYLDGKRAGVTGGDPPESVRAYAETRKWPPDEFSDYLALTVDDREEHVIELRKPCYETVQIIVKPKTMQDIYLEPVWLNPAFGRLHVQADAVADVYIDGERVGTTAQTPFQVCEGRHTVLVKNRWGVFSQGVEAIRGEETRVVAHLRPRVVYLGTVVEQGASETVTHRLQTALSRFEGEVQELVWINKVNAEIRVEDTTVKGRDLARRLLRLWTLGEHETLRLLLNQLAHALEARLFFVAHVPREGIPRHVALYLFSDLTPIPDRAWVDVLKENTLEQTLSLLTREEPLVRRDLPIRFLWTGLGTYPVIFWVDTQRLPRDAPTQPRVGDIAYAVESIKLDNPQNLFRVRALVQKREQVTLRFGSPAQQQIQTITVPTVETPVEIGVQPKHQWYHRLAIGFLRWAEREDDALQTHLARLNLALVYMRFHEWGKAFEWLSRTRIPRNRGISQPTVELHKAQCLLELGYTDEARQILERIRNAHKATVGSDSGRRVSDAAQEMLTLLMERTQTPPQ